MFVERHWVRAAGGRAVAEHVDGNVYLAISLRNVGAGIGVCQGWKATGTLLRSVDERCALGPAQRIRHIARRHEPGLSDAGIDVRPFST